MITNCASTAQKRVNNCSEQSFRNELVSEESYRLYQDDRQLFYRLSGAGWANAMCQLGAFDIQARIIIRNGLHICYFSHQIRLKPDL